MEGQRIFFVLNHCLVVWSLLLLFIYYLYVYVRSTSTLSLVLGTSTGTHEWELQAAGPRGGGGLMMIVHVG